MATDTPTREPVKFPDWARLVLSLVVAFLGYLVAGELPVSEELRGAISALTLFLASAGIVPPTLESLPKLSPQLRLVLTGLVSAGAYALSIVNLDPTVRGVIVAALALAASRGILPPQAIGRR
jgi:hypothetical protein